MRVLLLCVLLHSSVALFTAAAEPDEASPDKPRLKAQLGHERILKSAVVSPDHRFVLTADDLVAILWDLDTGLELCRFGEDAMQLSFACFSPRGQHVVTVNPIRVAGYFSDKDEREVRFWEPATGKLARGIAPKALIKDETWGVGELLPTDEPAWLSDTKTIDEEIRLNPDLRAEVEKLLGRSIKTQYACYGPDKQTLATVDEASVSLWDASTGRLLHSLCGQNHGIDWVKFSADGRLLLARKQRSLLVWDVKSGVPVSQLSGRAASVRTAAISNDSRWLVTTNGNTATIWDMILGRAIRRLEGHSKPVLAASLSADGRCVVTGGEDATAQSVGRLFRK